jgi:hypothetical protein
MVRGRGSGGFGHRAIGRRRISGGGATGAVEREEVLGSTDNENCIPCRQQLPLNVPSHALRMEGDAPALATGMANDRFRPNCGRLTSLDLLTIASSDVCSPRLFAGSAARRRGGSYLPAIYPRSFYKVIYEANVPK